jgi:SsrA-binding protein
MHIQEYMNSGKYNNYDPVRERQLLLNRSEINKLEKGVQQKGLTIVPLAIILTNTGYIKLEIGLAKGKNTVDKRLATKEKNIKKDVIKELNDR